MKKIDLGMDVISLTQKMLSFNTVNPPGNEEELARFTGGLLSECGFDVRYHGFGENRLHMIAERGINDKMYPLVLSGHFDVVPPGAKPWRFDPFAGVISDGKIWGRGSADMKGGLAAMIVASIEAFTTNEPPGGIRLIFTAGEELGCQGISRMAGDNLIPGEASAIIVGEPTGNKPATGHKGAIYLNASAEGRTAHSSMPEKGDNAIYKVAEAIMNIRKLEFGMPHDPLLGYPTLNVGKISGGMNINSVPDHAEFTVDIRTTSASGHTSILKKLSEAAGDRITFTKLVDLAAVYTPETDPFVQVVYNVCGIKQPSSEYPMALPYLTDGAMLQRVYNAPVVILGPGEAGMAHQTDEYCNIEAILRSVEIYREIILKWSNRTSTRK